MTLLFGRGTRREKLSFVLRATRMHALNLGRFTALYKFLSIALRQTYEACGGKGAVPKWHSFLAGLVAGNILFGERTPVNEQVSPNARYLQDKCANTSLTFLSCLLARCQIVLYTSSRVMASFLPRAETRKDWPAGKPKPPQKAWFAAYATITWGLVMFLHEYRRETLQSGMVNSMDCKYHFRFCLGLMKRLLTQLLLPTDLYHNAEKWDR